MTKGWIEWRAKPTEHRWMDEDHRMIAEMRVLLDRLVRAGWANSYHFEEDEDLEVEWNDAHADGLGGKAKFLGLLEFARELSPERPLSGRELANLEMLRDVLYGDD